MATLKTSKDLVQRGDLVVADLADGCGPFVAFVQATDFRYSQADGQEHTILTLRDQDGGHCDVTLDELVAGQQRAEQAAGL